MLELRPRHFFSATFEVSRAGRTLGQVVLAPFGAHGSITLGGERFSVSRLGLFPQRLLLERGGQRLALATRTSWLGSRYRIDHGGESYVLQRMHPFSRRHELIGSRRVLGTVGPRQLFSRSACVRLPDELPLELQLFLFWLVAWTRRHRARSS